MRDHQLLQQEIVDLPRAKADAVEFRHAVGAVLHRPVGRHDGGERQRQFRDQEPVPGVGEFGVRLDQRLPDVERDQADRGHVVS
jgi:hypothetical protein